MTVYDDDEFDSPEETLAHIEQLITNSTRRKQKIEANAALLGRSTPPEDQIELEDIQKRLKQLREQKKMLKQHIDAVKVLDAPSPHVPDPPQPGTDAFYQEAEESILVYLADPKRQSGVRRELIGPVVGLDEQFAHALVDRLERTAHLKVDRHIGEILVTLTSEGLLTAFKIIKQRKDDAKPKWHSMSPEQVQLVVLQIIDQAQRQAPNDNVDDTHIAEALQMDLETVRVYMDVAEEEGYTKTAYSHSGGCEAILTPKGRRRVRFS
jgi:hypothetical protein